MTMTDPVADMLTRIRNASSARHESTSIPASKLKIEIAKILKDEGFIKSYELIKDSVQGSVKVELKYTDTREPVLTGLKRVSKPGLHVYTRRKTIPRVRGGLGVVIMSTPQGLMTGREAWRRHLGGEVLAYVW